MKNLYSLTILALALAACDTSTTEELIESHARSQQLGIGAYAFDTDDDTLEVTLFDAARQEVGTVTVVSQIGSADLSVSLADSDYIVDLEIEAETASLFVNGQSSQEYALVGEHLQVLEAVASDHAVAAEMGARVAWRIAWPWDYVAYSACFYGAVAGGADFDEAGEMCHELHL